MNTSASLQSKVEILSSAEGSRSQELLVVKKDKEDDEDDEEEQRWITFFENNDNLADDMEEVEYEREDKVETVTSSSIIETEEFTSSYIPINSSSSTSTSISSTIVMPDSGSTIMDTSNILMWSNDIRNHGVTREKESEEMDEEVPVMETS